MKLGEAQGDEAQAAPLRCILRRVSLGAVLWRERGVLLVALASSVISPVASIAMPFAAKLVVDEVIGKGRGELLLPITLGAALGLLIQAGASYGGAQLGAVGGQRVVTRLRQRLEQHTMRLPVRFFDSHQSGALVSRIITDTEQVRGILGSGMLHLVSGAISGLLALAVLWYVNWRLTAVLMAVLVAVMLGLTRGFRRLHAPFRTVAELQ